MSGILTAMAGAKVAPSLTASAAPTTSTWAFVPDFGLYGSTDVITATPSGGASPYTYAWETVSGPGAGAGPTAAATAMLSAEPDATVMRCRVTDSNGTSAYTNNVSIS